MTVQVLTIFLEHLKRKIFATVNTELHVDPFLKVVTPKGNDYRQKWEIYEPITLNR